jgi:hypothetical protein
MSPQGLEDHDAARNEQIPLKEKHLLATLKAQILGGDGRDDQDGGKKNHGPLEPVQKVF